MHEGNPTIGNIALIKRLFQSQNISKVLFLVDRITLGQQADDALKEFLPEYDSYFFQPAVVFRS